MSSEAHRSFGRSVNLWVQTLAIIFAGLWGAYTFVYLEIRRPATAPINLSTQVSLREAGTGIVQGADRPLVAIELRIDATNPSTRSVHLLSNYWRATGYNTAARPASVDWVALANADFVSRSPSGAGQHYGFSRAVPVAAGNALPDLELKPAESVSRTYVFYVPRGEYDLIDVETALPSVSEAGAAEISWRLHADGTMTAAMHRVRNGERVEIEAVNGVYEAPEINLQMATSRRQLSLWRASE